MSNLALKHRNDALKHRTKFLLKFVRDISTKMALTFLRASVSVRDLSTVRQLEWKDGVNLFSVSQLVGKWMTTTRTF
jgi:hypothetical protein